MLLGGSPVDGPTPISVLGGIELLLRGLGGPVGEAPALSTTAAAATVVTAATPMASVDLRDAAGSGAIGLLVVQDLLKVADR